MNASHAASNSAKLAYAGLRLLPVETRSAFATRTVASEPPFDWGSAGTHVAIVNP